MKPKMPPVIVPHRGHAEPGPRLPHVTRPQTHAHSHAHPVARKTIGRVDTKGKDPYSNADTKADGQAFREALFGSSADTPTGVLAGPPAAGDFSEGGGNRQGQDANDQKEDDRRGGRRSSGVSGARAARTAGDMTEAAGGTEGAAAADGWMELEIESRVAGRIRLSVMREAGRLRARMRVDNPLAAQWLMENLPTVERELTDELGCRVSLEMA